ncbi:MAG: hypothetical protein Fur0016_29440 [Anaerolineales bacterium]
MIVHRNFLKKIKEQGDFTTPCFFDAREMTGDYCGMAGVTDGVRLGRGNKYGLSFGTNITVILGASLEMY